MKRVIEKVRQCVEIEKDQMSREGILTLFKLLVCGDDDHALDISEQMINSILFGRYINEIYEKDKPVIFAQYKYLSYLVEKYKFNRREIFEALNEIVNKEEGFEAVRKFDVLMYETTPGITFDV